MSYTRYYWNYWILEKSLTVMLHTFIVVCEENKIKFLYRNIKKYEYNPETLMDLLELNFEMAENCVFPFNY